ncbi:MAG: V-type ATP synthase subunit D [Candidatus Thermoplasmatota archaeon]|nr:V-type ATP synthase subunit D [Candidatus Thermoplasmatota archaeon]
MAKEMMEGVKPTRMQLLEVRKRKSLAAKGYELLSQKRDALISNFFDIIRNRKEKRIEMEEKIRAAFDAFIEAEMLMGEKQVRELSDKIFEERNVSVERKNVMGIPIVSFSLEEKNNVTYGILDTTSSLDEAIQKGRDALNDVIEVAGIEGSIQKLGKEIEKTKRRVNALEHIFIPKLEGTITYIERQLEEREREDFFRRKRMKNLMEKYG